MIMLRSYVVVLPLPPRELSPNSRSHWRVKARHVKEYRHRARYETAFLLSKKPPLDAVRIEARFFFRDKRRRDRDNLLASLKSAFDGIADAGLVRNDSDITHLPVVIDVDRNEPRVELHVTEDR